ncbi:energy-coupling factor ABC transporter substrate-binding protein [Anaerosolibacter sp.]|jgi:cobalt/nickel transport protein|uniref:energy-coupling factor ABC transporter substrate-binding protein n=1 Tax=Anaerosolibacter sp. TaxID=1872527 RepID=UPI00262AB32F|nr:energy-coupling factor ABC transporter substrate-binding protein [Anaerosolibacter sp.]MDF2547797.1 cobalt transporter substrate-binding protein CbiN [Anaerosolibacter sp.]
MTMTKKNLILILMVIIITIIPLIVVKNSEFGGADGAAEEMITEIQPNYEPWFNSIWEPPGGETESLLFALQAAIGTGIIAYYFGYQKGKKQTR